MSIFAEMSQRLRLQPSEEQLFSGWFAELLQRSGGVSRLSGGAAATFLKKSGLPNATLKKVEPHPLT